MSYILSASTSAAIERHCPALLDFRESGIPEDPAGYEAGTAAHAVMEAAQRFANDTGRSEVPYATLEALSDDVVKALTTKAQGARPPIGIMRALEGRNIAMRFLKTQGGDGMVMFDTTAIPEVDIAVDANWNLVPSGSKTTVYRGRLDLITPPRSELLDDGYEITVCEVTDYKTAWPTDETELSSWQFAVYTLLVRALYPHVTAIRRRVINLRTCAIYTDLLWTDDAGTWKMDRWKRDLALLRSFASQTPRPATPGKGCINCPAILHCKHAMRPANTPQEEAAEILAIGARYDALVKSMKERLKEREPLLLPAVLEPDSRYGFYQKQEKRAHPNAPAEIVAMMLDTTTAAAKERHGFAIDMLGAIDMTGGNVKAAIKRKWPSKGDVGTRRQEEDRLLVPEMVTRFGVHKVGEE